MRRQLLAQEALRLGETADAECQTAVPRAAAGPRMVSEEALRMMQYRIDSLTAELEQARLSATRLEAPYGHGAVGAGR